MADDSSMSASELRKRYGAGGTLPDEQLSASQLRARHAVRGNARDFSTRDNAAPGGQATGALLMFAAIAAVAVVAGALWWASRR